MNCPKNESIWKKRADKYRCQDKDIYHCLLLEDKSKVKEVCIQQARIGKGNCPIITRHNYLHWSPCNTTGCPNDSYKSDEVYKYPICFLTTPTEPIRDRSNGNSQSFIGVGISISTLIILALCVYLRRSKIRRHKGSLCKSRDSFLKASDAENGSLLPNDDENTAPAKTVLQELQNNNVILIHGTLGNGVSTTGKRAVETFKQEHTEWVYQSLNYRDCLNPAPLAEGKIIFVDGWFGIWSENPCEVNGVKEALDRLQKGIEEFKRCKIVIGLRENIYEKYKKLFYQILPPNTRYLDLDSIRLGQDEELERQLQRTLKKVNCKKRNCSCKDLNIQEMKYKYKDLGIHLKIEILASHHCFISKFMEREDLLETLVCHFNELQKKKKRLYECLMYIVLKGKYRKGDATDGNVIEDFHFGITSKSFNDCKSLHRYTKSMREQDLVNIGNEATKKEYIVFGHVFLYLCAFHSLFRMQPKMMMKHCDIDAILQIVRPDVADQDGDEIKFCAKAEKEHVTYFYKEVVKKTQGLEERIRGHPLVVHAIGMAV